METGVEFDSSDYDAEQQKQIEDVVLKYLIKNCYKETALKFMQSTGYGNRDMLKSVDLREGMSGTWGTQER